MGARPAGEVGGPAPDCADQLAGIVDISFGHRRPGGLGVWAAALANRSDYLRMPWWLP